MEHPTPSQVLPVTPRYEPRPATSRASRPARWSRAPEASHERRHLSAGASAHHVGPRESPRAASPFPVLITAAFVMNIFNSAVNHALHADYIIMYLCLGKQCVHFSYMLCTLTDSRLCITRAGAGARCLCVAPDEPDKREPEKRRLSSDSRALLPSRVTSPESLVPNLLA